MEKGYPMVESSKSAEIAKMSFEDALSELEDIVRTLEGGKGKLEEAITAYERGAQLKAHCEKKLKEAQAKVEKISLSAGGEAVTEPANID